MSTDPTDTSTDEFDTDEEAGSGASSRRALMLGSAGVAAAAVAAGLSGSQKAQAADGEPVILGSEGNTAGSRTQIVGPSFVVSDGDAKGSLAENVNGTITGVHGFTADSVGNRAVWGLDDTRDGVGVYGQHDPTTGPGTGVAATSGNGVGLRAVGTTWDVTLSGSGQLNFTSAGPITSTDPGPVGTLARTDDGSLWYSVAQGEWTRVASQGASSTFFPLEPTRVYDSRLAVPIFGPVPAGGARRLSVRQGRDLATGAVTVANLVPNDATAVAYNVTVDQTVGAGFLTVAPGDSTGPKASSVNWNENGQSVANAGIVPVDGDGAVLVFVGGPAGSSTDLIIDITGYYT